MTIALKAGVAAAEIPRKRTVLLSVAIRRAPTVDPRIENLPPASDVPPDHDREDRVELHLVAGARDVHGHDLRDGEQSARGREHTREDVHRDEDGPRPDAGEAARGGVHADGLDHQNPAPCGA